MDTDVYKAPESEIIADSIEKEEFYIVSPSKFLILQISTLGIYSIYWFYKHWQQYKTKHQEEIWPIARGIFQIFFVHALFASFYLRAKEKDASLNWSAEDKATIFVLVSIAGVILSFFETKITTILGMLPFPIVTWILYQSQFVANQACDDPKGEKNAQITGLNVLWIILGGVWWLFTLLGLYLMVVVGPEGF